MVSPIINKPSINLANITYSSPVGDNRVEALDLSTLRSNVNTVKIVADTDTWIDQISKQQLNSVAALPGMVGAIGFPDLHPGRGYPIGAAFITQDVIYPALIGGDIGCGMGFWMLDASTRKFKPEKAVKKIGNIDRADQDQITSVVSQADIDRIVSHPVARPYLPFLGTIGGGNHFAEIQRIEQVVDQAALQNLQISRDNVFLLVHSGSRGFGQAVLDQTLNCAGADGVSCNSEAAQEYLKLHDTAVQWAKVNRSLIARRISESLDSSINRCVLENEHNSVTKYATDEATHFIHRKGAARADTGPVLIPGSRDSLSYLVMPRPSVAHTAFSIAHGAGRKWSRTSCHERLGNPFHNRSEIRSEVGSRIVCGDKNLLVEEAGRAYKKIETIISALQSAELIDVIATLRPLLTYKVSAPPRSLNGQVEGWV